MRHFKKPITGEVLKFCRRELFQQVWLLLLDEDFMRAYVEGILVECGDGVVRRLFPRIFTYIADYPEKYVFFRTLQHMTDLCFRILATALKPLARCLCPRCLVTKDEVRDAGTEKDTQRVKKRRIDSEALRENIQRARRSVFKGFSLTGDIVQHRLESECLNPIQVSIAF